MDGIDKLNAAFKIEKAQFFIRQLDRYCETVFNDEELWEVYRANRRSYETLREFMLRYMIYRQKKVKKERVRMRGFGYVVVLKKPSFEHEV